MRSRRQVLLGSAAGIFTVVGGVGAQAADLPVKAPPPAAAPVNYVRVCDIYGAGFYYIPGTDTCIKLGVFNKLDVGYGRNDGGMPFGLSGNATGGNTGGRFDRTDTAMWGFDVQAKMSWDLRTQTEFGTLRQFTDVGFQYSNPNSTAGNATGETASLLVDRAFIQFAGLTAGFIRSFYDIFAVMAYIYTGPVTIKDTAPSGTIGIAYTWGLGGGWSFSLSAEDGGEMSTGRGYNLTNLSSTTGNPIIGTTAALGTGTQIADFAGPQFFDPIANIRLDQDWGYVAASAAMHADLPGYYTSAVPTGALVGGTGACLPAFGTAASGASSPLQATNFTSSC